MIITIKIIDSVYYGNDIFFTNLKFEFIKITYILNRMYKFLND